MSPLLLISFDNFARRKTSHCIKVKKRNSIDLKSAALICQNEIYNRERLLSRGIDWMEMLLNFEHWWIYHPEWLPVTSTRIMKTQNALSPAARLESSNQKLLSQNSQSSSVFLELWEEKCWKIFETKCILFLFLTKYGRISTAWYGLSLKNMFQLDWTWRRLYLKTLFR